MFSTQSKYTRHTKNHERVITGNKMSIEINVGMAEIINQPKKDF